MNKRGKVIIFSCLLLIALLYIIAVAAADEASEDQKVEKAYQCLTGKVAGKCTSSSLSFEEKAFSLLALAYNSTVQGECKSGVLGYANSDKRCWPSSGCKLKDTSLAILALNNIAVNTENAGDWLLSQNMTSKDLDWYLQIDSNDATNCTIAYSGASYQVSIGSNKKINQDAGSCLTRTLSSYWLKISSSCYSKNFTVSCSKDFVTSLLYTKSTSSGIDDPSVSKYVSSKTSFASASGTTNEKIETVCLKQGGSCNYEGTLWAALALSKTGHDVSNLVPYLTALAEDNEKYFPETFIFMITSETEFLTKITNSQLPQKYWRADSSNIIFYDTSLALLALKDSGSGSVDSAKNYLLNNQGSDGCWQSIRETAFVLYSAWYRAPSFVGGGETNVSNVEDCINSGHFCIAPYDCTSAGGQQLLSTEYRCNSLSYVCCTKNLIETCADMRGEICSSGKTCSDTEVSASDTQKCCLGSCITQGSSVIECTQQNDAYLCKFGCSENEEAKPYSCDSGKVCCAPKTSQGGSYLWIIILLIVLIILIVLAIIYRHQLKMWVFRRKNKFKQGPSPTETRPPFPPSTGGQIRRPVPMPFGRRPLAGRPMPQRAVPSRSAKTVKSKTDKELEETLRKLKEMSK
jgi:hypothetical protein